MHGGSSGRFRSSIRVGLDESSAEFSGVQRGLRFAVVARGGVFAFGAMAHTKGEPKVHISSMEKIDSQVVKFAIGPAAPPGSGS